MVPRSRQGLAARLVASIKRENVKTLKMPAPTAAMPNPTEVVGNYKRIAEYT